MSATSAPTTWRSPQSQRRSAPGVSDIDVYATSLLALAQEAKGPVAWDGCVGVGVRGDYFDAQPCGAVAAEGDTVFVDLFPRRNHYAGDSARSFAIGAAPAWAERLHAVLVEALCAVERLLRPGASAAALDRACRGVLESNDHNAVFPHHIGPRARRLRAGSAVSRAGEL